MSSLICDASVLFKLFVPEEGSGKAKQLAWSLQLVAPEFVLAEIANAVWSRIDAGKLPAGEGALIIDKLLNLPLEIRPIRPILANALMIASALGHPIYDCLYLALAESLDIPLVTADRRFLLALRRAGSHSADVRSLSDFV